jgi:hypothetical protein
MKRILSIGALSVAIMGCGAGLGQGPVPGFLYSDYKAPSYDLTTETSGSAMKSGAATCQSILGLIAMGDCSIEAAKKNGGISKVAFIDFGNKNILGVYAEYTTRVSGN